MSREDEGFWSWLKRKQYEAGAKARSPEDFKQATREVLTPSTFLGWYIFNMIVGALAFFAFWWLAIIFPAYFLIFSVLISLPLFWMYLVSHEACHAFVAKMKGYNFKFTYGSTAVVSVLHERDEKWRHDGKLIALAPYIILLPSAVVMVPAGIMIGWYGYTITGIVLLVTHAIFMYGDLEAIR